MVIGSGTARGVLSIGAVIACYGAMIMAAGAVSWLRHRTRRVRSHLLDGRDVAWTPAHAGDPSPRRHAAPWAPRGAPAAVPTCRGPRTEPAANSRRRPRPPAISATTSEDQRSTVSSPAGRRGTSSVRAPSPRAATYSENTNTQTDVGDMLVGGHPPGATQVKPGANHPAPTGTVTIIGRVGCLSGMARLFAQIRSIALLKPPQNRRPETSSPGSVSPTRTSHPGTARSTMPTGPCPSHRSHHHSWLDHGRRPCSPPPGGPTTHTASDTTPTTSTTRRRK